jgi:hypothetical protein
VVVGVSAAELIAFATLGRIIARQLLRTAMTEEACMHARVLGNVLAKSSALEGGALAVGAGGLEGPHQQRGEAGGEGMEDSEGRQARVNQIRPSTSASAVCRRSV